MKIDIHNQYFPPAYLDYIEALPISDAEKDLIYRESAQAAFGVR